MMGGAAERERGREPEDGEKDASLGRAGAADAATQLPPRTLQPVCACMCDLCRDREEWTIK